MARRNGPRIGRGQGGVPRGAGALACVLAAAALSGVLAGPASAVTADESRTEGSRIHDMDEAGDHSLGAGNVREAASQITGGIDGLDAGSLGSVTRGMDVSGWQRDTIDWEDAFTEGARFVYIKASEDTDYHSSWYEGQRAGALKAGLIVGAYHYTNPSYSTAQEQADYFFETGVGGSKWTADGRTLPPMVDLEAARPPQAACYGMSTSELTDWIAAFLERTASNFGRAPVVYTNTSWWNECIGDDERFAVYPLAVARWRSVDKGPGDLPGSWNTWTFWQHWDDGEGYPGPGEILPGDQQLFAGDLDALAAFARGEAVAPEENAPGGDVGPADPGLITSPTVPDAEPEVSTVPAGSATGAVTEPVASVADTGSLAATGTNVAFMLPLGAAAIGALLLGAAVLLARRLHATRSRRERDARVTDECAAR